MQIYNYYQLSTYLNDYFWLKKKDNPKFSLQSWATQLGISSPGALNQMINGKRSIPARFIKKIGENLKLNKQEMHYFTELYLLEKSKEETKQKKYLDLINPLKWRSKVIAKEKEVLATPLIFAIKTFIEGKRLTEISFSILRSLITKDISDDELNQGLQAAQKHTPNVHDQENRLVTTIDISSDEIKKIHSYYLKLADKRLHSCPVDKREYNNYSFNIPKDKVPEAKERIRFFLDSFIEEFNQNTDDSEVYQVGSFFYPLEGK